ncbi:PKD domain-containing protein [Ornithinimicrobium sufpigmenti]|uniref:PKD domain-containing protein n=1 Tax=Ornithinimicrobium sufpigmenti TaxID=2508882 RepID=UPI001035783D|nr:MULTISPECIES: PKD domain-containing protein [unclassified Ornithinimicrobium]
MRHIHVGSRTYFWIAAWVTAALVASLFAVLGSPSPAAADTAPHRPGEPRTVSADRLPTVQINGVVWDQVIVGDRVYVTGEFTHARPAGANPGQNQTPRSNILAYNLHTGVLISNWAPSLNAQGMAITASADGSRIYVGGDFSQVSGVSRSRIVALDAQTGAVIQSFNPAANTRVASLAVHGNTLYVGGHFSTVSGQSRSRLAAVNATTGALLPWAPSADREIVTMTVHPDSGRVIVGGSFSTVNGVSQRGMTSLDGTTGAVMPWAANQVIQNYGANTQISSLITDGEMIYGVGWAYFGAGGTTANFEGTFAADPLTGEIDWINGCRGDQFSVAAQGDVLYTTGHSHDCGMIGFNPESTPILEQRALAFDKRGSSYGRYNAHGSNFNWRPFAGMPATDPLHWMPNMAAGTYTGSFQAGYSVEANDQYLLYGGEFPRVNNTGQQGLVRFAIRDIAPNNTGLVGMNGLTPQLTQMGPGTVRVAWTPPWDYDNERLSYQVLRGSSVNNSVVVASGEIDTNRWTQPPMAFVDRTAPPGTTQTYRVRMLDTFGNGGVGSAATISVPSGSVPSSAYRDAVRNNGAIHHWRLDETTGTVARDHIRSNDLTLSADAQRDVAGALLSEDNGATGFPASADTRTVRGTTSWWQSGPQTFTVEAWFNTTSTEGGKIVGFGDSRTNRSSSNNADRHLYLTNNGQVRFGLRPDMAQRITIDSQAGLNDGQWHHAVATLSEDGARLYIDGELAAQNSELTKAQVYWGYWRVGGDRLTSWPSAPTREAFAGTIDEVAIYPHALTLNQVRQNYGASGQVESPNQAPDASFTFEEDGLGVTFDASASSDPDGTIASYVWNFGDGTFGSGVSPSHTYTEAGTYTVSLTVTDNDGDSDEVSHDVTVVAPPPNAAPVAAFTVDQTHLLVAVDASDSSDEDGDIVSYNWDFGDGNTGSGLTVNHTYAAAGDYRITLTVTDDDGVNDTTTQDVTVVAPPVNVAPTAAFSASVNDLTVSVDGSGSTDPDGTIQSWTWTFGDGSTDTGVNAQHTYAAAGTYLVGLTVVDDDGAENTYSEEVTVEAPPANQAPEASFSVEASGRSATLTSTSTDPDGSIASYDWDLGDGTSADEPVVVHTYAQAGTYQVTLTVTDDDGATGSVTVPVTVSDPDPGDVAPTASFTATVDGLTVGFDASASTDPDGTVESYTWSFGDGGSGSGVSPTRTYVDSGSYTVTLTVVDDDGLSDSVQQVVQVSAPPGAATFATDTFNRSVNNGWGTADLGGPWTSSNSASVFSVSGGQGRIALRNAGSGPAMWLNSVSAQDVEATVDVAMDKPATGGGTYHYLAVRRTGNNDYRLVARPMPTGTQVLLTATVNGADQFLANTTLPLTYSPGDVFRLRLVVEGTNPTVLSGKVWRVGDPEPANWQVTATNSAAALQGPGGIGLRSYLTGSSTNAPVVSSFDNLHVGGIGRAQGNQTPVAAFTTVVDGLEVAVDGSGSSDPDGSVTAYAWNFGDGSPAVTGATRTHTYEEPGTYQVTLTVTDDEGATHAVTRPVTVEQVEDPGPAENQPPVAVFTHTAEDLAVSFDGSGSSDPDGTITAYAWTFGDGNTGTGVAPRHTYAEPGTFQVTLTVTDEDGATHDVTQPVTVDEAPAGPEAAALDSFTRNVTAGWGSADIGGSWTTTGSSTSFRVADGQGVIRMPNAGGGPRVQLTGLSAMDTDTTLQVSLDKAPSGGDTYISVASRHVGTDGYRAKLRFMPTQTMVLLSQMVNGTESNLAYVTVPGATYQAGDVFNVRFQVHGEGATALRAKIWRTSETEPTTWQVTATNAHAALQRPGGLGVVTYLSGSANNSPVEARFDNVSVTMLSD